MKKAALFVTTALLLALVAPVFAQPFADVPTDHWAYDAIAELAAKGLVEGYPDGTFKGDRALTRYEMAMIVARLLARIEAVAAQIPGPPPPPPKPEVTKADLDKISRLVREFQTDLQALGVRIESIEEELRNLRASLDKTKITGSYSGSYTSYVTPKDPPVQFSQKIGLEFTGQVAPNVAAVAGLSISGTHNLYSQPDVITKSIVPGVPPGDPWDSVGSWSYDGVTLSLDKLYLDVKNILGALNFRLGRQPISFGPYGLLLSGSGDAVMATTSVSGIELTAVALRHAKWSGSWDNTVEPETAESTLTKVSTLAGRASFKLIPGWEFGVNLRSDAGDARKTEESWPAIGTRYAVTITSTTAGITISANTSMSVMGTNLSGQSTGTVSGTVNGTFTAFFGGTANPVTGAITSGTFSGSFVDTAGTVSTFWGVPFSGTFSSTTISGTISIPGVGTATFSGTAVGIIRGLSRSVTTTELSGQGLGFDLSGSLFRGVSLNAEYMSWTPSGGSTSPFLQAGLGFNLSELTGTEVPFSPTLDLAYKKFGATAPGVNTKADTDLTAWGATLGLKLTPTISFTTSYESVTPVSAAPYADLTTTVGYDLAQNTKVELTYFNSTKGPETYYKLSLTYKW